MNLQIEIQVNYWELNAFYVDCLINSRQTIVNGVDLTPIHKEIAKQLQAQGASIGEP